MTPASEKLVIAISSRALFNLDAEHLVYEQAGLEAYSAYQIEHEDETLDPGEGFSLVKKLFNQIQQSALKSLKQLISKNMKTLKTHSQLWAP